MIFQSAEPAFSQTSPNIVLIISDDQSYADMQFLPKTNALIGDLGVRFNHYYTSTALCCPARASILTGLYGSHHNVVDNKAPFGGAPVFSDSSTLATWLSNAGYRTSLIGKYLNNYGLLSQPYIPPGWSDWFGVLNEVAYYDYRVNDNGVIRTYGSDPASYATDVLKNRAIQSIQSAPANQPLFLYVAPSAPHNAWNDGPAIPAPEDVGAMSSIAPYRPPNFNEADVSDKPLWVRNLPLMGQVQQDRMDALHQGRAESLQAVDRAVEAIINELAATGRLDNTIVIFTSDNGYSLGSHRWEKKRCIYEECSHLPLLIRGPGISPGVDNHFIENVDLTAAIAEWASITPPTPLDGTSFVSLMGDPSQPGRDNLFLEDYSHVYTDYADYQGVRTKDYLYAKYINGDEELYDMNVDPYQLTNIASDPAQAATIDDLRAKTASYRSTADIGVSIGTTESLAQAGNNLAYSIVVTNNGPATSNGVVVTDALPPNTTFASCSSTGGGVCAGTGSARIVISFMQIKPGASATIAFVVNVKSDVASGATITNSATVSSFSTDDLNAANDTATVSTPVRKVPIPYQPVGYWKFDEGGGTTAGDSSGNNNVGSFVGGVSWTQGHGGSAIALDGTSGYVSVPDGSVLDGMGSMTVGAWVNLAQRASYDYVVVGKDAPSYRIMVNTVGKPYFRVKTTNNDWNTAGTTVNGPTALPLNTWTHIVGTYDGSYLRIYVNGILSGTSSQPISGNIYNGSAALRFGYNSTGYLKGSLDEIAIYDHALRAPEVWSLYTLDTAAPTVSITSPLQNATVSGVIPVNANAADASGISKVAFYADGALVGTDTTSPYSVSWNTASYAHNSSHALVAKAYDPANNVGTSAAVTVTVADVTAPAVAITSPANDSFVSRNTNVTIQATASDVSGISKLEFLVNGSLKCSDASTPYTCVWKVPNGKNIFYTLQAKAYDAAGNTDTSSVQVTSK